MTDDLIDKEAQPEHASGAEPGENEDGYLPPNMDYLVADGAATAGATVGATVGERS